MPTSYRERLSPPPIWWAVALVIGGTFGLVMLPLAGAVGLVIGIIAGAAIAAGILAWTTADVRVEDGDFMAGRARIPTSLLGEVEVLDRDAMSRLRGRDLDARAYLCQRGWIRAGVRVGVDDPADPAPYWLVSSRHPRALAAALEAARLPAN